MKLIHTPDEGRLKLMHEEHGAWLDVVVASRGVTITESDWHSSPQDISTPGRVLIFAIRAWGEALVRLRGHDGNR